MDMPLPTTLKQLCSFQGKLLSIRRFVSQLADKVHPLQHFLRKGNQFQWDCLCQKAFEQIKTYLANPPVLVPPVAGRPLILYISATSVALGALLA